MDHTGDRKAIAAKAKQVKIDDRQRQDVVHQLMSTAPGRAFVWDLLGSCHVFASTFTPDALASAFREGERNVGLRILADILTICPDQYIQAQRESNERHLLTDLRSDHPDNSTPAERRSGEVADGGDPGRPSTGTPEASEPDGGWNLINHTEREDAARRYHEAADRAFEGS